jgi:uncharacterized Zn finger protein
MAYRDCPHCGCNDTDVVQEPNPSRGRWWGSGSAKCNHCGLVFSFRPPIDGTPDSQPAKIIPEIDCPGCGATMRVSQTRSHVRYLKCPDCGETKKVVRKDRKKE